MKYLTPKITLWGLLICLSSTALAAPPTELAGDQSELALKFDRLETLAKRIAELAEKDSPERAEQLRTAIRKSQELALPDRFQTVVKLLEGEQLAAASDGQTAIADQLRTLLDLLLADPNEARLEAERKRLREILKQIRKQIRTQRELRAAALSQADPKQIAGKQGELADDVSRLERELKPANGDDPEGEKGKEPAKQPGSESSKSDKQQGKPSQGDSKSGKQDQQKPSSQDGQPGQQGDQGQQGEQGQQGQQGQSSDKPPSEPSQQQRAAKRLADAQQAMQEAIEQLEQSKREGAEQKQADAQRALEDAKEEIEKALRQLREEEQQRRLTKLAVRLKRMLSEQIDINKLTEQTAADRENRGDRATKIAAAGLATREQEVGRIADGALRLLREDAKSVAFPEVLSQIREDIGGVTTRLTAADLGLTTQELEAEIVASLEEAIESLDKTLKEMEERKQAGQQGQSGGQPGEPPVVDKLAELRMIRTLQARILRRTKFWHKAVAAGQAKPADAREALDRMALRQQRLSQAARSLQSSR